MAYFLLLENGDYLLLENGGKIIITVFTYDSIYTLKFSSPSLTLKSGDNNFIIKNINPSNINITEAQ